ncbi:MAG: hypothetical protein ACYC8W_08735 [Candidatus Tyrphobacter sp.]
MLASGGMNDGETQLGLRKFPRRLAREVKKAAAERGITLTQFMVAAATNQLRGRRSPSVNAELERDVAWYDRHRKAFEKKYPFGMNLAIVGQKVVDCDPDVWDLSERLSKEYGRRPIFMPRIGEVLPKLMTVRTPRFMR